MDWQKMFTPWILEWGRNYWDDGCVGSLYRDGNTVAAVLFAMDEDIMEQPDIPHNGEGFPDLPWQEALNGLSPEEIRQILSELAQSDRGLQERIATLQDSLRRRF